MISSMMTEECVIKRGGICVTHGMQGVKNVKKVAGMGSEKEWHVWLPT